MIAEALRLGRELAYRLASPADALWRGLRGRAALPPLWLRRHTGAVASFESSARDAVAFLDGLGLLRPGRRVLDVGCGAGALVPELARRLGPNGAYVGFDVHAPSIRWCRRAFGGDARFRFEVADVASPYGRRSGPPARRYRFPADDASCDLVIAKSVFTHLLPDDAVHYLSETRRVLSPGATAVVTAFLFDPERAGGARRAFPHAELDGLARFRLRSRPTAAVAYARPLFETLLAEAGLRLAWLSPGYYPGSDTIGGQDTLLVGL